MSEQLRAAAQAMREAAEGLRAALAGPGPKQPRELQRDELLRDVQRVLAAWDTTTHQKNGDGRLWQCMAELQETFNGICADEGSRR